MKIVDGLLAKIDRYIKRAKIGESRFGRDAKLGSSFVGRLRRGNPITTDTYDYVLDWIEKNPPEKRP